QGSGEEHVAVRFLAPQKAPDIGGDLDLSPDRKDPPQRAYAIGLLAAQFAQVKAPRAAVGDHARLDVISGEVDEGPDRPLRPHDLGDEPLAQAVLQRDDNLRWSKEMHDSGDGGDCM